MKKILSLALFLLASIVFIPHVDASPVYQLSVITSDNPNAPHLRFQGLNDNRQILGTAYGMNHVINECVGDEFDVCPDWSSMFSLNQQRAQLWQSGQIKKYVNYSVGLGLNNSGDALISTYPADYLLYTKTGVKKTAAGFDETGYVFYPLKLFDNAIVYGVERKIPTSDMDMCTGELFPWIGGVEWDGNEKKSRDLHIVSDSIIKDTNSFNQLLVVENIDTSCSHAPKDNVVVIDPGSSSGRDVKIPVSAKNYPYVRPYDSIAVAINKKGHVLFVDGSVVRANGTVDNSARQILHATLDIGSKVLIALDFNDEGLVLFRELSIEDFRASIPEDPIPFSQSFIFGSDSALVLYVPGEGIRYLNVQTNYMAETDTRFAVSQLYASSKPSINNKGDIAFSCGDDVEKICFLKNTDAYIYPGKIVQNINLPGCVKKKRNNTVELSLDLGRFLLKKPSAYGGYSGNFKTVKSQEKYSPVIDRKSTQLIVKELNAQASDNCRIKNVSPQIQTAILDKNKSILKITMKYKVSYMVKGHKKNGIYQLDASMPINGQLP